MIPPRVHIFLWLLANNKTHTRDNLVKRRKVDDETCLFCSEKESVNHVFFQCCVAKAFWVWISEIAGRNAGTDFELVATCWLSEKRFKLLNVLTSAALWTSWKTRNELCFQGKQWVSLRPLAGRCARMLRAWTLLQKPEDVAGRQNWGEEDQDR
jgi:hypothetical protein